ncbi:hypothetical protein ES702_05113 [subsurface metagenome]
MDKDELKNEYRERVAIHQRRVGYFFDANTMVFFKSRVHDIKPLEKEIFFITSERFADSRRYSIRVLRENGNIDEVSKFQEYSSLRQARKELGESIHSLLTG